MDIAHNCLQAADVLQSVMGPCFGPNGMSVLLEGSDGHVCGTSCGVQLLSSLQLLHPTAVLLSRAIKRHYAATGDGCKKFLIMLTAMLRDIYNHSVTSKDKIEVSHALNHVFDSIILSRAVSSGKASGMCFSLDQHDFKGVKSMCFKIINTCLSNSCTYYVKKTLREISMTILFPENMATNSFHNFKKVCNDCYGRLDELILFQAGSSVSESRVYPGFLIERNFVVEPVEKLESFRVLLLHSDLGIEVDSGDTITLNSRPHLMQTIAFFTHYTERVVSYTKKHNIRMILCGGRVSPAAVQMLRKHSVAAIEMVPEETLVAIAEYCGTVPLSSTIDLVAGSDRNLWVNATSCEHVRQKRFVHLQCLPDKSLHPIWLCGILLCAPTTEYCWQLATILRQTLKVLDAWCLTAEGGSLVSVCGGGVWEIALSRETQRYIKENNIIKGSSSWIALNAFHKGLLAIACQLVHQRPPTKLIHISSTHHDGKLLGVDCIQNCLTAVEDPTQWPAWEPLWSQQLLVHSVCEFLSQLLSIDQVLCVRGRLSNRQYREVEDDHEDS